MNKGYYRKFITLEMEGRDKQKSFGTAIIEARDGIGKVNVNVQNIRGNIDYIIELVQVAQRKSTGVSLGTMKVMSNGKGAFKWEGNGNNVEKSGIAIEEFDVIIVKIKNSKELITPLVGYYNEKVLWRNNYVNFNPTYDNIGQNKSIEQQKNAPINQVNPSSPKKQEENIFYEDLKPIKKENFEPENDFATSERFVDLVMKDKIDEQPKEENKLNDNLKKLKVEQEQIKPDNVIQDELFKDEENKDFVSDKILYPLENIEKDKPIEKRNSKNIEENKNVDVKKEPETSTKNSEQPILGEFDNSFKEEKANEEAIFKAMIDKLKDEIRELKKISTQKQEPVLERKSVFVNSDKKDLDIHYLFENNTKIIPFARQNIDVEWVEMDLDNFAILPRDFYKYIRNDFFRKSYKKFGKFILGRYNENGKDLYLIGVPDYFEQEKESDIRMLGFIQFKSVKNEKIKNETKGYWIKMLNNSY